MNLCMRDSVLDIPLSSCLGIFSKNPTKRIIRCRKKWSSSCVASRQVAFLFRTPKKSLTVFFLHIDFPGVCWCFYIRFFFGGNCVPFQSLEAQATFQFPNPSILSESFSIWPMALIWRKVKWSLGGKTAAILELFFFLVFGVFFVFCWV